jgi:hypothetical protein
VDGSYRVLTPALTTHARTMSGLADQLRGAFDAARTGLGADAYGQTCQRFAAALDTLAEVARETLLSGVEALETEAANLRDTATEYAGQDARGSDRLDRAAGDRR